MSVQFVKIRQRSKFIFSIPVTKPSILEKLWVPSFVRLYTIQKEPVSLKTVLKQFYRLVHPDLFGEFPHEKEQNEKSLQNLMSWLNSFQEEKSLRQMEDYELVFYCKPNALAISESNVDTNSQEYPKDKSNSFQKISLTVRTPDPLQSPEAKDKYLFQNLSRLFGLCGLTTPFIVEGYSSGHIYVDNRPVTKPDVVGLSNYIYEVSHLARARTSERVILEREVDMRRTILWAKYKLKPLFNLPTEPRLSVKDVLQLQCALQAALDNALEGCIDKGYRFDHVKNLAIVFGTRRGLDQMGRVNVHFLESPAQWVETLLNVNVAALQQLQAIRKKREEKEMSLGKKLGIAYFYADYTLSSTPEYYAFLCNIEQDWEKTKSKWNFASIPELSSLKVRVLDPEDHSVKHYSADYSSCGLLVPCTCAPLKLFDFLDEKGLETIASHKEFVRESERLNSLLAKVKRVFRLRALTYDNDLPVSHLINCCLRLLQCFHKFDLAFDGLRIHIGSEYAMNDEDGTVSIRWDFKI
jgi:hypothetical protein